jgi:iron complex transport system permease protein
MSIATVDLAFRRTLSLQRAALLALGALLIAALIINIGLGPVAIAPWRVLAVLLEWIGLPTGAEITMQERAIVTVIRLPRACLAILVGAALATSGALMQGLFRNPLADPTLVGVSSGAAAAAIAMIVIGVPFLTQVLPAFAPLGITFGAFLGGLIATVAVYRIGSYQGRTLIATILLAGIAINAIGFALSGLFIYLSSDQQMRDITFWTLGSLATASWQILAGAAPLIVLAMMLVPGLLRGLNAYLLGEREAGHLGFKVQHIKRTTIVVIAIAVGTAVACSGLIGFVGLIVPHLVRLMVGADHRVVVPGSALLGATLLLLADLIARTIVAPAELPIGLVTSLIGGPFFLWLLMRRRRSENAT